jgi:hypothetical protein
MTPTDLQHDPDLPLNTGLPPSIKALGVVDPPRADVLDRSRTVLLEHLATSEKSPIGQGAARAQIPRRRVVLAVAASIVVAGAAVAAPSFLSGPGDSGPAASASAVTKQLQRLAVVAGQQRDDGKDAAYWYSKSLEKRGRQRAVVRQVWLGHSTPGRVLDPSLAGGSTPTEVSNFGMVGPDHRLVPWDALWTLPTDPAKLGTLLRQGSADPKKGKDPDAELYVVVGDMLRESPAPPALRAALYRVIATIPGVRLIGPVTDPSGRRGVAVERAIGGGIVDRYVFDPADARMLAESETGAKPGPEGGGESWSYTYLTQGPVPTDHAKL